MKLYSRSLVLAASFISLFLVAGIVNANISIPSGGFNLNPTTITSGTTINYDWKIVSTDQTPCGSSGDVFWSIERIGSVPADRQVVAHGVIKAAEFLINQTQTKQGKFNFTPIGVQGSGTSEGLQLRIGCSREPGSNIITSYLTRSAVITINVGGQSAGAVSIKFDAKPNSVNPDSSTQFQFTILLTGKQSDFTCTDGLSAPVVWTVYMWPAGHPDDFSDSTRVQQGAVRVSDFGTTTTTLDKSFPTTVTTPNQDFVFKAQITCIRSGSDILTTSSAVPISAGGFTGGKGTGNGTSGGTPGQTQNYSFEISNPLKGGASDFTSLVKIIAQWIFNLAIPIAVAMIVYAGILFLISAGDTSKITKAREVLTYAVVGLAIILIGSGFVTLIQSILELGGTGTNQQSQQGLPPDQGPQQPASIGVLGSKCSGDRNCVNGLKCGNALICQRPTGNFVGEPCNGGASCDVGLACDTTGDNVRIIDGQTLGKCFETSAVGGRIGDVCTEDKDCISGLKCNQICQRKNGNLNDEACLKTSNPSNCQSKACHTVGTAVDGDCVPYSGT